MRKERQKNKKKKLQNQFKTILMVIVNAHKNGASSHRCARGRCCFFRQQIYVLY